MANNIVLNPQAGDSIVLSQVATSFIQAQNQYGPTGSTTYSGTITGGANNGLAGKALIISGFTTASNNGTFLVLFSTATTLLMNNAFAVAEIGAGLATYTTQSFPLQYGSKIANMWSNQNGEDVVVNANAGDLLVAIAIGLKSYGQFDLLHGTAPYTVLGGGGNTIPFGFTQGLNDFNADPTISDQSSNVWTLAAHLNIADSDYIVAATPPVAPNPYPSSKWNIDGYYPSIYIWTAPNVAAGSYKVNLNSMYQSGVTSPTDYTGGALPIFDGGVDFQVYNLSGAAAASVVESSSISTGSPAETTSNPSTAPATLAVANANGDALISVGLMKAGNTFAAGLTKTLGAQMTQIGNGNLINSEAHYIVEYALVTAAGSPYNPGFVNPLGYPMLVASLAIKSS